MKKSTLLLFFFVTLVFSIISAVFGGVIGAVAVSTTSGVLGSFNNQSNGSFFDNVTQTNVSIVNENSAIIEVAEQTSESVVSVIISRELTALEKRFGMFPDASGLQQVGSGSGFIISEDGLVITNKHVVREENATYTIVFNDGSSVEAEVVGRDPLLDIAIMQIDPTQTDRALKPIPLGDSDSIKVGQNVIAIGNSLGRFSNTVSTGIISGLSRDIIAASEGGFGAERLTGVIQTDASINPGNSGGPLLDIKGNVIGVNVAVAQNAENIGFAIPINLVLPAIDSVQSTGEIKRPLLGVRYQEVTPTLAEEEDLPVTYGAWLQTTTQIEQDPAVVPGSAADEAGLQNGDIIIKINDVELRNNTSLQQEIQKLPVGASVEITYIRGESQQSTTATLKALEE